jgi:tetratricopeptide (TPR) repeat protein
MRGAWTVVAAVISWVSASGPALAQRTLETPEDAYRTLVAVPEDLTNAERERLGSLVDAAREREPDAWRWRLAETLLAIQASRERTVGDLARGVFEERPDSAPAAYALAAVLVATSEDVPRIERGLQAEQARDLLIRAVELDPSLYAARKKLIEYYLAAPPFAGGDDLEALELSLAMLSIDGQEHLAHFHAGLVEAELKNWGEMDGHFEKAIELAPDAEFQKRAMFSRAWAHFSKREDYRVSAMIGRFCADGPYADDFRFHFITAESLRNLGDCELALVYYDQVLALEDEAPLSLLGRGRCLERLGRTREALDAYRAYLDRYPVQGDTDEPGLEARRAVERLESRLR